MKFGFRLYDTEADSVWSFVDLRNVKGPLVTNKLFTYTANQLASDDYSTPINEDYPNQFRQVTFYIDLAELYATGYYFNDNDELDERSPFNESYGYVSFRGIMPYVYWSGNHHIELDYIEIEDEIHRIVTDPVRTVNLVRNRLNDYSNIPSSAKFYTRDEPSFAHFDSYKRLQDIFGESGESSDISQNLIATINATKLDKKKFQSNKRYSHFTLFEDYTEAKELMIDFYPLTPEANWNNPYCNVLNSNSQDGIQFLIDWKVSTNYRRAKIVAREKPFYVVPCTAGRWNTISNYWSGYQYPTINMMKCLQYLPLCYGVKGVIDFKLYSGATTDTLRWYALIDTEGGITETPQYEAIKQANAKLAIYGPILQDLEWIDATTISTGGLDIFDSNMYSTDEAFDLGSDPYFSDTEIYIDPNNDNNDLYNGYVHIGFFQDDENYPTYMLVNRRTDYVNGTGNNMRDIDPATMMSEYNEQNAFREASSQLVKFDLDQNIVDEFGEYVSLFDPASKHSYYKNESAEICVEIDPGEGIMLELASTLPDIITENITLKGKVIIDATNTIVIPQNITIATNDSSRVYINQDIEIPNGAKLILRGDVEINSTITVKEGGELKIENSQSCAFSDGVYLSLDGGKLEITDSFLTSSGSQWAGIRTTYLEESESIIIENSTIKAYMDILIFGTPIDINNSSFYPIYTSLTLGNFSGNNQTNHITNSKFIPMDNSADGITLIDVDNMNMVIDNVEFERLSHAINIYYSDLTHLTIVNSNFDECTTGINLSPVDGLSITFDNNDFINCKTGINSIIARCSGIISDCSFICNDEAYQCIGIDLSFDGPKITNCSFNYMDVGIKAELMAQSGQRDWGGI